MLTYWTGKMFGFLKLWHIILWVKYSYNLPGVGALIIYQVLAISQIKQSSCLSNRLKPKDKSKLLSRIWISDKPCSRSIDRSCKLWFNSTNRDKCCTNLGNVLYWKYYFVLHWFYISHQITSVPNFCVKWLIYHNVKPLTKTSLFEINP